MRVFVSIWQLASLEWVLSKPMLYFKWISGSVSHFPKVRFHQSIWLYSIPCACMTCFVILWGLSNFDVEFVVMYFFENIHLLLILKCIVHYLVWPLIAIFAYDMLWLVATLRRLLCFESKMFFPSLVLSSVCLRTSNSLSMGSLISAQTVYHFRVILPHFYRKLYGLCNNL